jgi:hypothetical protein
VRPFYRDADGLLTAEFDSAEREILLALTAELSTLLRDADEVGEGSSSRRALDRLLPDAYPDDAEASAEFRRFTTSGILDRKVSNAATVQSALLSSDSREHPDAHTVALDAHDAQAWMRCITDLRLVLAVALGIEREGDENLVGGDDLFALDVYHWLGLVLETLLDALAGPSAS